MTARTPYEDWPSDDILTLRRLWATGLSTAKIGEAMHRSKNSIIGKAHRLNLAGRPSPILRDRVRAKRKWPKRMTARTPYEDWPSDDILTLRRLWATGLSAAKIGEAMGRSKKSIVGKAYRLNLAGRPSPILRDRPIRAKRKWPKRIRQDGQTLAPLHSLSCEMAIVMPDRPPASVASFLGLTGECCWPIGHPGAPGYRSCDSPCHRRANYCEAHAAIAYARKRDADPDWLQPA